MPVMEKEIPSPKTLFKDFEIKDFRGIASSNRNPQKNECQLCKNFDLRDLAGDLVSRTGYRRKYVAPAYDDHPGYPDTKYQLTSVTELRTTNFVVDKDGTETEITLTFAKGILTRQTDSGASPTSINIGLFFMRPYFESGGWQDEWLWLNECYLTTLSNLSNNEVDIYGDFPSPADYFKQWTLYNIDNDDYAEIYDSVRDSATLTTLKLVYATGSVTHNFANSDNVLVMRNFIPYADLKEYSNVAAKEVSFHNVLDELRISFGGVADRLALMVGFREHTYNMRVPGLLGTADTTKIAVINKIVLTPHNSLTEDTKASTLAALWANTDVFHILRTGISGSSTDNLPEGRWFFKLTALIDGYQEFVLPSNHYLHLATIDLDILGTNNTEYFDTTGSQRVFLWFRMFWSLFNKRITKLRLYVSYDSAKTAGEAYTPYYRIKEWNLLTKEAITYSDTHNEMNLNDYGYAHNYEEFHFYGAVWNNLKKTGANELTTKLGYPIPNDPADDYVRGYDQAVAIDRKVFVFSPYVSGERVNNTIYFSPFGGSGAPQYDALQGGNYIFLDSKDGNNLRGLGMLPNANLAAFKTNNLANIRASTAQIMNTAFGHGLETFRSIVNQGDKLTWCSQEDIFRTTGVGDKDLSEFSIRSLYRAMGSKSLVFASREERDNAYRFFAESTNEYLLTKRGWVNIVQNVTPEDYIPAADGTLWYMKDGIIYYQTGTYDVDAAGDTQNIACQWKSIPIDTALVGEGLSQSDMFWIDGVFMLYSSPNNLTMKVYLDGSLFDTITFSSANTYDDPAIKYGGLARRIEIEVTGTASNSAQITISSIGFRFRPVIKGNRV